MAGKEHLNIRPSQVTRTFGPGSIYDNQKDSMIVMGLDHWKQERFNTLRDEILLQEIKRNGLSGVTRLVSVSSFKDPENPGTIPVRSFPTWGFCPVCNKLVSNRNSRTGSGVTCDTVNCGGKRGDAGPPKTYPVRFVAACKNGHLDDFPWYRWVHRTKSEQSACGPADAELYLFGDSRSISLVSRMVGCKRKKCIAKPRSMSKALSKNGIMSVAFGCTGRRPWLGGETQKCEEQMRGVFKGATNIYFPLVRSAVTIPPFSDELSGKIMDDYKEISRARNDYDPDFFKQFLEVKFELRSKKHPDGKWTFEDVQNKISALENFSKKDRRKDVHQLEFDVLNSGDNFRDEEFVTENLEDAPAAFKDFIDRAVLVKKIRVISALTSFTRIDPFDPNEPRASRISTERLTWLPANENRGEGIFFCMNNSGLKKWQAESKIIERFEKIMTVQGRVTADPENYRHEPKYVFLHTFSHAIIRGLSAFAGYSTASLTERIYSGDDMAGILIYTSSPSSDGALGGLVDLGNKNENRIWDILENTVRQSTQCSCDPLCAMQDAEKTSQLLGASCHACTLLPETCCENANSLLDREMLSRTLKSDAGFIRL